MNFILDIGNNFSKFTVFESNQIVGFGTWDSNQIIDEFDNWIQKNKKCDYIIVSDVKGINTSLFEDKAKCKVVWASPKLKWPFKVKYKTTETIGVDRLGLAAAAVTNYPNQDCLIIDLGTCITYDFIDRNKLYYGGAISPGLIMRYNSLNSQTSMLPKLEFKIPDSIIGESTTESIHSGIFNGIVGEIKNHILEYQKIFGNIIIILTGGDADKLSNQIKNGIFANYKFFAKGLHAVLELNKLKN